MLLVLCCSSFVFAVNESQSDDLVDQAPLASLNSEFGYTSPFLYSSLDSGYKSTSFVHNDDLCHSDRHSKQLHSTLLYSDVVKRSSSSGKKTNKCQRKWRAALYAVVFINSLSTTSRKYCFSPPIESPIKYIDDMPSMVQEDELDTTTNASLRFAGRQVRRRNTIRLKFQHKNIELSKRKLIYHSSRTKEKPSIRRFEESHRDELDESIEKCRNLLSNSGLRMTSAVISSPFYVDRLEKKLTRQRSRVNRFELEGSMYGSGEDSAHALVKTPRVKLYSIDLNSTAKKVNKDGQKLDENYKHRNYYYVKKSAVRLIQIGNNEKGQTCCTPYLVSNLSKQQLNMRKLLSPASRRIEYDTFLYHNNTLSSPLLDPQHCSLNTIPCIDADELGLLAMNNNENTLLYELNSFHELKMDADELSKAHAAPNCIQSLFEILKSIAGSICLIFRPNTHSESKKHL